jgi:hypothetical protein
LPNREHGLPVTKNPSKPPKNIELRVSPVNSNGTGLASRKTLYNNPKDNPITTPRKGFQKYQVEKNSFTLFGLGVTLQLASIFTYLYISMQR